MIVHLFRGDFYFRELRHKEPNQKQINQQGDKKSYKKSHTQSLLFGVKLKKEYNQKKFISG